MQGARVEQLIFLTRTGLMRTGLELEVSSSYSKRSLLSQWRFLAGPQRLHFALLALPFAMHLAPREPPFPRTPPSGVQSLCGKRRFGE